MAATSQALAPARRSSLNRATGAALLLLASIGVAGVLVAGATQMGRGSAAPLAASGAGHAAPITSPIERELEVASSVAAAPGSWVTIGPSTLTVISPITGRGVRVPAASSPREEASQARTGTGSVAATVLVTSAGGVVHRLPLR